MAEKKTTSPATPLLLRTVFRNLKQRSLVMLHLSLFPSFLPSFLRCFLHTFIVVAGAVITLDVRTLLFHVFFGKPHLMDEQRETTIRVCMCVCVCVFIYICVCACTQIEVDLFTPDPRDCLDFPACAGRIHLLITQRRVPRSPPKIYSSGSLNRIIAFEFFCPRGNNRVSGKIPIAGSALSRRGALRADDGDDTRVLTFVA